MIDCKTGKEKPSDKTQVLIYMLLLPLSPSHKDKLQGMQISGQIQYQHHRADVTVDQVNADFKTVVRKAMKFTAQTEQPGKVPSFGECRWCDITAKRLSAARREQFSRRQNRSVLTHFKEIAVRYAVIGLLLACNGAFAYPDTPVPSKAQAQSMVQRAGYVCFHRGFGNAVHHQ